MTTEYLSNPAPAHTPALESTYCPALFIAAPSSGQGKTTVTAALARFFARQGKIVRVFKTGPDYLDPQILEQASGQPVEQLDMWMAGEHYCQQKLYQAALVADLILVEGAMGLFDGQPSSADLAARFNIPIALLMDVKGMAQTAAAIATGLANYRDDYSVAGLIANNCGSERHAQLIENALPEDLPLLAILKRDPQVALPERHLGLVQAAEIREELEIRFEMAADWLADSALTQLPAAVQFFNVAAHDVPSSQSISQGFPPDFIIGIAKDEAFSFIYDANLRLLSELGAQFVFFSPLHDQQLPAVDALWLPGGYPELYADKLAQNSAMRAAVGEFFAAGKGILAECGGFLYCLQSLTDLNDQQHPMLGILPGHGAMRGKRGCQGMQTAVLPEGEVRAHAHHRSRSSDTPEPLSFGRRQSHPAPGEAIYRRRGLTASYLHLFFPSNSAAISAVFNPPSSKETAAVASEENTVCASEESVNAD